MAVEKVLIVGLIAIATVAGILAYIGRNVEFKRDLPVLQIPAK